MIGLSIKEIVDICSADWTGFGEPPSIFPDYFATDSRSAGAGSLFIAIRGARTDGHLYIPAVLKQNACAVLCEEAGVPGEPRIVVPDVMKALWRCAEEYRRRFSIPFIGITGSVGKTTAKEMVSAVLSAKYKTYKTPGSLNGQLGLPISILSMPSDTEAAVIEMGVSDFGEMTRLTNLVKPSAAVFTLIGDAHLEFLHDRNGVLKAKSEILLGMEEGSAVICNGDDPILNAASFCGFTKTTFGLAEGCCIRGTAIQTDNDFLGFSMQVHYAERTFSVHVPAYGDYMAGSALSGIAVGLAFGLSDDEIREGVSKFSNVGHRSRVVRTPYLTLVDDCYNANPTSNRVAIDSLVKMPGRHVCIMGDMNEMGERAEQYHIEIGKYMYSKGINLVLFYGRYANSIAAGFPGAMCFDSKKALTDALSLHLKKGDSVLVKASHSCCFETVAEAVERIR